MENIGVDTAKLWAGLHIDLLQKLRSGNLTAEQLRWFLHLSKSEREYYSSLKRRSFAPSITIKIGTGIKTKKFQRKIEKIGCRVDQEALYLMEDSAFTVSEEEKILDLVFLTKEDLGLKDSVTRGQTFEKAISLGLELCPPEVGPQLRLQYLDQPQDQLLLIGMDPIREKGHKHRTGDLSVFWLYVNDDSGMCVLDTYCASMLKENSYWVFVLPRS